MSGLYIEKSEKIRLISNILEQVEKDYSTPIAEVIRIINISPRVRVGYVKLYDMAIEGTLLGIATGYV